MTQGMFHFPLEPEVTFLYIKYTYIHLYREGGNTMCGRFHLTFLPDAEEVFEHLFNIPFPQFEYPRLCPFFNLISFLT